MRTSSLAAVAGFLILAAFCLQPVWSSPTTLLLENVNLEEGWGLLGRTDQSMVLSVVMRNADLLLSDPAALRGWGPCFPFPQSFTLGEHAFGEGVLAMLPWAVTGDPILSYNFVLLITFFLPGFTMFVWARYFTGSAAAGFIAGMLFQLIPSRIFDGGHPFLHADYWFPLAMLALHRLFVTGRAGYAFLLAALLVLQSFASIYLLIGIFVILTVYGSFLLWRHPQYRARGLAASLSVVVVVTGFAVWLLNPYLTTREQWDLLAGRDAIFAPLQSFLPGDFGFPGWVFAGLVLIGLLDRGRGPILRAGEDPRLIMVVAIVILVLATFSGLPTMGGGTPFPPLLVWLSDIVPGLDAVRAPSIAGLMIWGPLALVAGYGARALLAKRGRLVEIAGFSVLVLGIAAFRFVPALASASFGPDVSEVEAWRARPAESNIALAQSFFRGAIAELPVGKASNPLTNFHEADRLLLNSYAPHPTTSCYNSFPSPYADQMSQLLKRLPRSSAVAALHALGVETLTVYPELFGPRSWDHFQAVWASDSVAPEDRKDLRLLGTSDTLQIYRLSAGGQEITADAGVLTPGDSEVQQVRDDSGVSVRFRVQNNSDQVYREDIPLGYREGFLTWQGGVPERRERSKVRFLMPVVLGPGVAISLAVRSDSPRGGPGTYGVSLVLGGTPDRILGESIVEIP